LAAGRSGPEVPGTDTLSLNLFHGPAHHRRGGSSL